MTTKISGTLTAAVCVLAAISLTVNTLTACSQQKGNTVKHDSTTNPALTEEAARTYIFANLQRTVDALPEIGFSLTPDSDKLTPLDPGGLMPCYDGYKDKGPHQVQLGYWVTGIPHMQLTRYFAIIRRTWMDWGWKLDPAATNEIAGLATPDNYTFILQDAKVGDGGLSVTAASPCFPFSGNGWKTPQPAVIRHAG